MARRERTERLTNDGGVVLNSSEWSTIRHALTRDAERYRDVVKDLFAEHGTDLKSMPAAVTYVASRLTQQRMDCEALVQFIDEEGLV